MAKQYEYHSRVSQFYRGLSNLGIDHAVGSHIKDNCVSLWNAAALLGKGGVPAVPLKVRISPFYGSVRRIFRTANQPAGKKTVHC